MRNILASGALLFALCSNGAAFARPVVAIIDSGIAQTDELRDLVKAEYDVAALPARPAFRPAHDHGTMVATILVREAQRNVDIISMRIDDPAGCPEGRNPPCQPSARPVVAAIDKAVALRVDAINMSLSLGSSQTIVDAVRRATAAGILVIMAAGNNGAAQPDNRAMARAGYPKAVLVGALDKNGQPWTGTNRPEPDKAGYAYVWRTGVRVPTSSADGRAIFATGTSFAAPIETARRVSGLARRTTLVSRGSLSDMGLAAP